MATIPVRYEFRQSFRVPARTAYAWLTDYRPSDGKLFGQRMRRAIRPLAPGTLLLSDTTWANGRPLTIRRLVQLDPDRLAWTNTHVNGPYRYSQHLYRIVPDGPRRCHLEFRAFRLERIRGRASPRTIAERVRANRTADASVWRTRFAPALESSVRRRRA
ncbi:MAG TPA: hypothetical protein VEL82_07025 [Thermoplasmata archaeon]|nr:hypothetical protein [Thermoplasmata archaeon]